MINRSTYLTITAWFVEYDQPVTILNYNSVVCNNMINRSTYSTMSMFIRISHYKHVYQCTNQQIIELLKMREKCNGKTKTSRYSVGIFIEPEGDVLQQF